MPKWPRRAFLGPLLSSQTRRLSGGCPPSFTTLLVEPDDEAPLVVAYQPPQPSTRRPSPAGPQRSGGGAQRLGGPRSDGYPAALGITRTRDEPKLLPAASYANPLCRPLGSPYP